MWGQPPLAVQAATPFVAGCSESGELSLGIGLRDRVRFQVSALWTSKRCDRNGWILLEFETHPEARLGFSQSPVLLAVSALW